MSASVRPRSLAEAVEAVRGTDGTLGVVGAGTKPWGNPVAVDVQLDTTGLDRVIAHRADDATLAVEPGMRLADLQDRLAAHGQRLAIDPPHERATVGGVFAADDHGPARLAHGTLRDLVIGATVVLSDGTVARTGGHVIKNVAGYDLGRLLCGSLGTLGLAVELVLRLHPLPAATTTVAAPADPVSAAKFATRLAATTLEPAAFDLHAGEVLVRFEGHPEAVAAQATACAALLEQSRTLPPDEEQGRWAAVAAHLAGTDGSTIVRIATLPDALVATSAALHAGAAAHEVPLALHHHVALGLHTAVLGPAGPNAHDAVVRAWRDAVAGSVVIRRRAPGTTLDAWGDPPSAAAVMRRVKEQLDPLGRFAPGRFVDGI